MDDLTPEEYIDLFTKMLRIRAFNEREAEESHRGNIYGYVHLYTGMEAVAVGVITALQPGDKITSTHRAEGHFIAAGVPLDKLMAECYGRTTGVCGGRGGPMGLAEMEMGVISAFEVVGGGIALATGVAWAFKKQKVDNIVVCFFGDGASNQGVLYECMNMAALWKLPILYACENNGYAVDTSIERASASTQISARADGFGLPGVVVDGTDVLDVLAATRQAANRARGGDGPTFLEVVAPRWCGHSLVDAQWYYRTREEVMYERQNDPVQHLREHLLAKSILDEEGIDALQMQVGDEIEQAVRFAESSPWPAAESLFDHLFVADGE